MNRNELIRFAVNRIKKLSSLREPNYDLPADSFIEKASKDILDKIIDEDELKTILDRQTYLIGEQQFNLAFKSARDILVNSILCEIRFFIKDKQYTENKESQDASQERKF